MVLPDDSGPYTSTMPRGSPDAERRVERDRARRDHRRRLAPLVAQRHHRPLCRTASPAPPPRRAPRETGPSCSKPPSSCLMFSSCPSGLGGGATAAPPARVPTKRRPCRAPERMVSRRSEGAGWRPRGGGGWRGVAAGGGWRVARSGCSAAALRICSRRLMAEPGVASSSSTTRPTRRAALGDPPRGGLRDETAADGFSWQARELRARPRAHRPQDARPDGIGLLQEACGASPSTVVVVMTAFGTIDSGGAGDQARRRELLTKPLDPTTLVAVVERAMEKSRLLAETAAARAPPGAQRLRSHHRRAPSMRALLDTRWAVGRAGRACSSSASRAPARSSSPPRALHRASQRRRALRAAQLARPRRLLLESELSAREGRFHHRHRAARGALQAGRRGTLFLDEVSERSRCRRR